MKKLMVLALSLMMMLGCAGKVKQAEAPDPAVVHLSHEQVIKHAGESTVALVFTEEGRTHSYCSGVWVSETTILTAAHCPLGYARHVAEQIEEELNKDKDEDSDDWVEVEVDPFKLPLHYIVQREVEGVGKEPGAIHLAQLVKLDIRHDLALIKVSKNGLPSHEVAEVADEVVVGSHLVCVGHPSGLYWTYVDGSVAAVRADLPRSLKKGPFVQVNADIWMGNSGGGAFDRDGKLVGIASFLMRVPGQAFYVHRDSVAAFLYPLETK